MFYYQLRTHYIFINVYIGIKKHKQHKETPNDLLISLYTRLLGSSHHLHHHHHVVVVEVVVVGVVIVFNDTLNTFLLTNMLARSLSVNRCLFFKIKNKPRFTERDRSQIDHKAFRHRDFVTAPGV